ncbi:Histone chaperone asf1 [Fusarium falciforme]|nr:Histone chaperone asf1 [Fusarium falciforme]
MSVVSLLGVKVNNNPAKFTDKYEFEITFECLEQLEKDLEWKLTYVGSATSDQWDQELDSLLVGPIPVGVNKFIFEADAPQHLTHPRDRHPWRYCHPPDLRLRWTRICSSWLLRQQ